MTTKSIRIDQELGDRLSKLAKETGRSQSWYIRKALTEFLSQEEWMTEAIQDGIKQAGQGKIVPHDDVKKKWHGKRKNPLD